MMRTKAVCPGIRIRTVPAVSEAEMQAVLALEALEQTVSAPEAEKDGAEAEETSPKRHTLPSRRQDTAPSQPQEERRSSSGLRLA